jgi:hypothetical protein
VNKTVHEDANKSGAIEPGCLAGSSLGITAAAANDQSAKSKGVKFQVPRRERPAYAPSARSRRSIARRAAAASRSSVSESTQLLSLT